MNLTGSSDFDTFTHRYKMEFNTQGVPRNPIRYFSATCGCKNRDFQLYFKGVERGEEIFQKYFVFVVKQRSSWLT